MELTVLRRAGDSEGLPLPSMCPRAALAVLHAVFNAVFAVFSRWKLTSLLRELVWGLSRFDKNVELPRLGIPGASH